MPAPHRGAASEATQDVGIGTSPGARDGLIVAVAGLSLGVLAAPAGPTLLFLSLASGGVIVLLASLLLAKAAAPSWSPRAVTFAIVVTCLAWTVELAVFCAAIVPVVGPDHVALLRLCGLASAILLATVWWCSTWKARTRVAAAGYAMATVPFVALTQPRIDVLMFRREGIDELLAGRNPYSMTFSSPYDTAENVLLYAKELVGPGGRLEFGFPYPPPQLLIGVPGQLLGDPRWSLVVVHAIVAALLFRAARDDLGRWFALAFLLAPATTRVMTLAWTDVFAVDLMAVACVALSSRWRSSAVWFALALLSKQYFLLFVPLFLLVVPSFRALKGGLVRQASWVALTVSLVTVPFVAWDLPGFVRSVVEVQVIQPYRADAFSWLVWWGERFGQPPVWIGRWLSVAASLGVAVLLAWRAPRTPAAFAASGAAVILLLAMLGKQSFVNYLYFALASVLVAIILWRSPDETEHSVIVRSGA